MSKKCTCGFEGTPRHEDIYDCVEYQEVQDGKIKGQWMIDWMKKSKNSQKKSKKKSGFKAWIED